MTSAFKCKTCRLSAGWKQGILNIKLKVNMESNYYDLNEVHYYNLYRMLRQRTRYDDATTFITRAIFLCLPAVILFLLFHIRHMSLAYIRIFMYV